MTQYVAFLRGINSGGNRTVKMDVLRKAFEDMGFGSVATVLASGNVLFETPSTDRMELARRIDEALSQALGFPTHTFVRIIEDIQKLVAKDPFKGIELTPQTRPYVTFVDDASATSLTYPVSGSGYTILGISDGAVCSVVDLSIAQTPDLMKVLDKEWKRNTTRAWSTLERILKVSDQRNTA